MDLDARAVGARNGIATCTRVLLACGLPVRGGVHPRDVLIFPGRSRRSGEAIRSRPPSHKRASPTGPRRHGLPYGIARTWPIGPPPSSATLDRNVVSDEVSRHHSAQFRYHVACYRRRSRDSAFSDGLFDRPQRSCLSPSMLVGISAPLPGNRAGGAIPAALLAQFVAGVSGIGTIAILRPIAYTYLGAADPAAAVLRVSDLPVLAGPAGCYAFWTWHPSPVYRLHVSAGNGPRCVVIDPAAGRALRRGVPPPNYDHPARRTGRHHGPALVLLPGAAIPGMEVLFPSRQSRRRAASAAGARVHRCLHWSGHATRGLATHVPALPWRHWLWTDFPVLSVSSLVVANLAYFLDVLGAQLPPGLRGTIGSGRIERFASPARPGPRSSRPSTASRPDTRSGQGEVNPLRTAPLFRTWDYSCSEKSAPERVSGPC